MPEESKKSNYYAIRPDSLKYFWDNLIKGAVEKPDGFGMRLFDCFSSFVYTMSINSIVRSVLEIQRKQNSPD